MVSVIERTMDWVDFTVDQLRMPAHEFPVEALGRQLLDTFETDVAALNWRKPDGRVTLTAVTRPRASHGGQGPAAATAVMLQASNSDLLIHHPLIRWAYVARSSAPQSINRVPFAIGHTDRSADVIDVLHSVGVDQELTLPIVVRGSEHVLFSLDRAGADDFSDEDLDLAARIQPLLMALHHQAIALGSWHPVDAYELTGRESAVLRLLATGRTSEAIGRTLGCSARTVEKHLEHLYRKLGVTDRVSAVRIALTDGLVPGDP